jgi:hypothetical protein
MGREPPRRPGGQLQITTRDTKRPLPELVIMCGSTGSLLRRYATGPPLAMSPRQMRSGDSDHYFPSDNVGSVADVLASDGTAEWSYAYEPCEALRAAVQDSPAAPRNLGNDRRRMGGGRPPARSGEPPPRSGSRHRRTRSPTVGLWRLRVRSRSRTGSPGSGLPPCHPRPKILHGTVEPDRRDPMTTQRQRSTVYSCPEKGDRGQTSISRDDA